MKYTKLERKNIQQINYTSYTQGAIQRYCSPGYQPTFTMYLSDENKLSGNKNKIFRT